MQLGIVLLMIAILIRIRSCCSFSALRSSHGHCGTRSTSLYSNTSNDDPNVGDPANDIPFLSMNELLSPPSSCDVKQMGPTALAYIGDVVFELLVRSKMVWPSRRTSDLQDAVVSLVRAEHQAKLMAHLLQEFHLTPEEHTIVVRGRNSGSAKSKRRKSAEYSDATALETLIGYLYITNRERCEDILNFLSLNLEKVVG